MGYQVTRHGQTSPSKASARRSGWVAAPASARPTSGSHTARSQPDQYHLSSPGSRGNAPVVTIGQFFATLRRRFALVTTCLVIGLALSVGLLMHTAKSYQSTAVVDISPIFGNASATGSTSTVSTITEAKIATSASVALTAKQTLNFAGTPADLAQQVTVSSPLASQVLNITFTSSTATGAAKGANAFANAYLAYRTTTVESELKLRIARINAQVENLQKRLGGLAVPASGPTNPQYVAQQSLLQNQIQQLQTQLNTYQTSVVTPGQVAGEAAVPTSPSSPKSYLYLAGGFLVGLLLGIVLAVVRDRRDDRVRAAADLEHSLSAPVIAETASAEVGSKSGSGALVAVTAARGAEADAYRTVTTTVTSDSAASRIVMLCGTGREGRSLAPLNLAATFAFQGLTTVIAGPRDAVEPATQLLDLDQVPAAHRSRLSDRLAASRTVPGLFVLSLGDEVSLGATLRANGDNLNDVLAKADIIVLDGINIELPSTSLRLGQIADEAVVIAYKNRTTHLDVVRLAQHLAQVRATVLGGILLSRKSGLAGRFRSGDKAASRPVPQAPAPALGETVRSRSTANDLVVTEHRAQPVSSAAEAERSSSEVDFGTDPATVEFAPVAAEAAAAPTQRPADRRPRPYAHEGTSHPDTSGNRQSRSENEADSRTEDLAVVTAARRRS